jgi:hypothetical protein
MRIRVQDYQISAFGAQNSGSFARVLLLNVNTNPHEQIKKNTNIYKLEFVATAQF